MSTNNTKTEEEFSFFGTNEHYDTDNPQSDFWAAFEENEPITLWGADELCNRCFQQPGYHYADIDRQLFVCDDCYNQYFSVDPAIPPPIH